MARIIKPEIDNWYETIEGTIFKVIDIDDSTDVIEVQFFEGEVAELELDQWNNILARPIAPPEDWSGPFDDLVSDDFGDTDRPVHPEDWDGPWDNLERKE